ncbi:hypothetical protein ASE14_11260 [Agromyces sp. Root81]|nr:hypothetical protein ASE14_11260 [Agromyces sp. Root81]
MATPAAPADIARWAVEFARAGVAWPTVHRLGVGVRLAGLVAVIDLGSAAVEGPDDGREAVRRVLSELGTVADPAAVLQRVASTLRQISVPAGSEGAA